MTPLERQLVAMNYYLSSTLTSCDSNIVYHFRPVVAHQNVFLITRCREMWLTRVAANRDLEQKENTNRTHYEIVGNLVEV